MDPRRSEQRVEFHNSSGEYVHDTDTAVVRNREHRGREPWRVRQRLARKKLTPGIEKELKRLGVAATKSVGVGVEAAREVSYPDEEWKHA